MGQRLIDRANAFNEEFAVLVPLLAATTEGVDVLEKGVLG